MARPGVTEKEVFEAIQSLREVGIKETVESIRAKLGHGSPNTINRHLRTWRANPPMVVKQGTSLQVKNLKKQQAELEAQLQASIAQTERLSHEILERDKKLLSLEKTLEEGRHTLKAAEEEIKLLRETHRLIREERQQMIDALIDAQKTQAEQFREDVKAINQMSLSQVREMSIKGQDRWLEEKVKVRELKQEIEQLKALNETLNQKVLAEQKANQPLRKRIAAQDHLIAHCLDPTKLETFSYSEEVR